MSESSVTKVIFAPDLIGAAFVDSNARKIVELWRDGALKIVTNRELIALHLRCLKNLGLSPALLSRWALWLSDSSKAVFDSDLTFQTNSEIAICESLAELTGTERIIAWRFPVEAPPARWTTAGKFLKGLKL